MLTQYRLLDPWSKLTYDRLLDPGGHFSSAAVALSRASTGRANSTRSPFVHAGPSKRAGRVSRGGSTDNAIGGYY